MPVELASAPATPLERSLPRLEAAASPLTGIAGEVVQTAYGTDDCRLANVSCRVQPTGRTLGERTVDHGSSWHVDRSRARAAALGEALERYSGAFVPADRLVPATAAELGDAAVDPARFALFHARQYEAPGFPFSPYSATTRLHFVEGFSLPAGEPVYVPAQLVFLLPFSRSEARIGYSTSNGLACGPTLEEALLSGLLELVERDALMLAWNNRLSLPLLDWRGDEELRELERRFFAPSGLAYSVLDGSVFLGVPVAICVLRDIPGRPSGLALGAGCGATVGEAWLKAVAEAFAVRRWLRNTLVREPERRVASPADVVSFDDHMLFYATPERGALAAFLDTSPERTSTSSVPRLRAATPRDRIEEVVRLLAERGVSVYAVDVTAPDVRSLELRVVRAIAPELCALDVFHLARYLGGTRSYRAAYEAGLVAEPLELGDINPLPHPFP